MTKKFQKTLTYLILYCFLPKEEKLAKKIPSYHLQTYIAPILRRLKFLSKMIRKNLLTTQYPNKRGFKKANKALAGSKPDFTEQLHLNLTYTISSFQDFISNACIS